VNIFPGTKCLEITDQGLTVITQNGDRQTIIADTVIPSLPLEPNEELFRNLEGKVPEVYAIGDCARPGLILEAIAEGSRVAHGI